MAIKNPKCTMVHDDTPFLRGFDDHRMWLDPNTGVRWEVGVKWRISDLGLVVCVTCPQCGCAMKDRKTGFDPIHDICTWVLDYPHAGCDACRRSHSRMNVPAQLVVVVREWHGLVRDVFSKKGATSW